MILETLKCLAHALNSREGVEWKAVVSSWERQTPVHENQLVLSLLQVEEEQALRNFPQGMGSSIPALPINLFVLITCRFGPGNYHEALDSLSGIIHFFHQNPVFIPANAGLVIPGVERFTIHMYNFEMQTYTRLLPQLGDSPILCYKIQLY